MYTKGPWYASGDSSTVFGDFVILVAVLCIFLAIVVVAAMDHIDRAQERIHQTINEVHNGSR